jgi:myo-inositol-1(or 4)-monophosphatase
MVPPAQPPESPDVPPDVPPDLAAARETAVAAARGAGQIQRKGFGGPLNVRMKGAIDLVTEVDLACERHVVDTIRARFPDHAVLAEEGGATDGASDRRWVIDPLDGTTNFAHRFPFFCVSIALEAAGEPALGVVYAPMLDELFVAERGRGATLNGAPLAVSGADALVRALLVTGFAYDVHHAANDNLDHFAAFTRRAQATRRTGCAALDLSYVAAGRFDGFWELGLKPWDMAAGSLMVTEAGGRVTRFDGSPHRITDKEILASNGRLHAAMIEVLAASAPR